MLKICIECSKEFNTATVTRVCSDGCRNQRKLRFGAKNTKTYRDKNSNQEVYRDKKRELNRAIIECKGCNKTYSASRYGKKTDLCEECYIHSSLKCTDMAKRGKQINNTTGLIGVYVLKKTWGDKGVWGVLALLDHNRLTIFRNKYKDYELHEKTFIQAAVDRDIYILQNDLPHSRNFTDSELEAKMFYLGYDELTNLKYNKKV